MAEKRYHYETSVWSVISDDAKSVKYTIKRTSTPITKAGALQYNQKTAEEIALPELTIVQATALAQEILGDLRYLAEAADTSKLE